MCQKEYHHDDTPSRMTTVRSFASWSDDCQHDFLSHREESVHQWTITFLTLHTVNRCLTLIFTTVNYLRGHVKGYRQNSTLSAKGDTLSVKGDCPDRLSREMSLETEIPRNRDSQNVFIIRGTQ